MYRRRVLSFLGRTNTMYPRRIHQRLRLLSLLALSLLTVVIACLSFIVTSSTAVASSDHVDVMTLNTEIDAASARFLTNTITTAEHDGAQALVIQIDTPGGDINSMKAMVEAELNSSVPIITYVWPTCG